MVITLLSFLLLSNSILLRRDKSIVYSRVSITILLISLFIAYDNLFFLFLNKGIGIFVVTGVTTFFISITQELLGIYNLLALKLFNT